MRSLRLVLKLLFGLLHHVGTVLVLVNVFGAEDAVDVLLEVAFDVRVEDCPMAGLWLGGILLVWGLSRLCE